MYVAFKRFEIHPARKIILSNRLVPGLKNMPVPVLVTLKIRYTNRKARAQRPFLLAGELAYLPAEF